MAVRLFVAALFAVLAGVGSGRATDLPAMGAMHRSTVFVFGKPVPLPPGDWMVVGQGFGPVVGPSPGAYGAIGGVVLARQSGGSIDGLVLAHANLLPVEGGWGPAAECRRLDAHFATGVRTQARNLACAYVLLVPSGDHALTRLPAWSAARTEAVRRGWRVPGALAVAGLRVGDRRDVVDVRYAWAVEAPPDPTRRSSVQRAAVDLAPAPPLRLPASALVPWTLHALSELEARMADPLAQTNDLPLPGTVVRAAARPDGASRWERRVGMAVTNRFLQASLAMGAGLVVTGNPYTAGLLAAFQTVAGGVGSHLVDLGWDWETPRPAMEFGTAPAAPTG